MDTDVNSALQLDPELETAIDDYLAKLRVKMVERATKGEATYGAGAWKRLSPRQLDVMIEEEVIDKHNYNAMKAWRFD